MISKVEAQTPPLFGLVLTGGKSTRMGRDKAALQYGEKTQAHVCYELLSHVCSKVYLSNRAEQANAPAHKGFPQIHDTFHDIGPLGGILSALQAHRDVSWLVVACDLPYLDAETLNFLIGHRRPQKIATAFLSTHDGLPEPLCAIYEPASFPALKALLEQGIQCPRKALIRSKDNVELLALPHSQALDNVNSPEEFEKAVHHATAGAKRIHVHYHAMLREAVGRSSETIDTPVRTASELFEELRGRYNLPWPANKFRVAINDDFCDWQSVLHADDTVIFIPPVAGGCACSD